MSFNVGLGHGERVGSPTVPQIPKGFGVPINNPGSASQEIQLNLGFSRISSLHSVTKIL